MQSSTCPICGNDPWGNYFSGDTDFERVFGPCECELAEREAEIAAQGRYLEIETRDLGDPGVNNLEAFYCEYPSIAGMAIQPHLDDVQWRAREIEAHGYFRWIPRTERKRMAKSVKDGGGFMLFKHETPESVTPGAAYAIGSVIERMEPEWVKDVADAKRLADDARLIAAWVELPLQAVMGALEHLKRQRQTA